MSSVILGIPLDAVTGSDALDVIGALIADGRARNRTHQIATVNVDFIVNAMHRDDLLSILQRSSLNLADGAPVVWASPKFGGRLPERVAGADLFAGLGAASAERGWRVHVLGGAPGVGNRALSMLRQRHPDAQITVDPGPMLSDPADIPQELVDDIVARDADILCVALGNPKQEFFIDAHRHRLGCPVMIGIGGSMDLLVGDRRRAPRWVQRIGAEWIVRAAQEPRRLFPRYFVDFRSFLPAVLRQRRDIRRFELEGTELDVMVAEGRVTAAPARSVRLVTDGDLDCAPNSAALMSSDLPIHIDLRTCRSLTPVAHATVCSLVRAASRFDRPIRVDGWNESLRDCFDRYGTGGWIGDVIAGMDEAKIQADVKTFETRAEIPCGPIEVT